MKRTFSVTSGSRLRCKGWRQEGILRLLENVLAVGEDPKNLVVYAALGKAARDWPSHDKIVDTLRTMDEDETLIVQSGKPIGLIKTHAKAPIVILANAAEIYDQILARGMVPDVVTDHPSAHDLVYGYVPVRRSLAEVRRMRTSDPKTLMAESRASIVRHVRAMLGLKAAGAV